MTPRFNIPRQRRYPMRPQPKAITVNVPHMAFDSRKFTSELRAIFEKFKSEDRKDK